MKRTLLVCSMIAVFSLILITGCNQESKNAESETVYAPPPLRDSAKPASAKSRKAESIDYESIDYDGMPGSNQGYLYDEMAEPIGMTQSLEDKALTKGNSSGDMDVERPDFNTESYDVITENPFVSPIHDPLSTFSIDVDVASYANIRRFLNESRMPPKGAVRIEEMINYFDYDYTPPKGEDPFAIHTELADCPWNDEHMLLHIGLKGEEIARENIPPTNLVFLLDVSGSMEAPNKLPLLKSAFRLLVDNLRPTDRVAIAVYAGAAGLVLPSTPAKDRETIFEALDQLSAGGSTAGGAGIELAYKTAKENFIKDGNNRVVLATDGDFNIGVSSESDLLDLIEDKRDDGIFLSVLGFGTGNYQDSKMELIADKGNGNYAYIDNILEAKKVLVKEMGGTLFTIAKDVKLQLEFNPNFVKGYRLIGYENRVMATQDFNDDTKDAGELGAGHTVTALYEVVPMGADTEIADVDKLKYQKPVMTEATGSDELLTVKFRYKQPDGNKSKLLQRVVECCPEENISERFRWSAGVAAFGMLLRNSEYSGTADYNMVLELAKGSKGDDPNGYRAEMIQLVEKASLLSARTAKAE